MPRKTRPAAGDDAGAKGFIAQWVMQTGDYPGVTLTTWDPKCEQLITAILGIAQTGATVVMRPGSGGRSIGIAIWEGNERHPSQWLYTTEELDEWAETVIARLRTMNIVP